MLFQHHQFFDMILMEPVNFVEWGLPLVANPLLVRRKNTIFKDSTLNLEYCHMKTIWHWYDLSLMVDGPLACETKKKCKKGNTDPGNAILMMDFYHCSSLYNSSFAVAIFPPLRPCCSLYWLSCKSELYLCWQLRHVINPAYVRGTGTIAIRLKILIIIDKYFLF